jgi:transmembrane 9 superfamily protein 1
MWGARSAGRVVVLLALLPQVCRGGRKKHFEDGEPVELYANKVGPYVNPSETYNYYDLPFCRPADMGRAHQSLGEVLKGDEQTHAALFDVRFKKDVKMAELCKLKYDSRQVEQMRHAIKGDYYFEFLIDKLPMWGFVGETKTANGTEISFLFTHLHIHLAYNGDQVIEASVSTDATLESKLEAGTPTAFTYSVSWTPTRVPYSKRMEKYAKASFLPMHLEIHWFSIINSFVTVILLTGFLATIMMRVLKNDFVKYERDVEADEDDDESGWKMIHGDVFRFPQRVSLLCSVVGVGTQVCALMVSFFLLGVAGVFHPHNGGSVHVAIVALYALTAAIAGYASATLFRKMQGKNWVRNVVQTSILLALPFFGIFFFENSVAWYYDVTTALPFPTIVLMVTIWSLVTFPLTVFGAITGRQSTPPEFDAPCRTTKIPREIPVLPWYRQTTVQMGLAGLLPFSAIYIEIYYIFASVWGHKTYTVYSILFIVFVLLIMVTSFINIALTYFQLAAEDHHWWWRSVFNGGSTGVFIYAYSFFYWVYRSEMDGFVQASFFFGYMAIVCYAFFLMLGAVGFLSSLVFVRYIYRSVKCD